MKRSLYFLFMIIAIGLFTSCAVTDKLNENRDGTSFEQAVIVRSVSEEYEWVKKQYPDSRVVSQSLVFNKRKPYDILHVETSPGTQKEVYFDISSFYGKLF